MSKKGKASPATQEATRAVGGGSEKKEKKKDLMKLWMGLGCATVIVFVGFSVSKAFTASSNVKTANILYSDNVVKARAEIEEERAKHAIENEVNNTIIDDNSTIDVGTNEYQDNVNTSIEDDDCYEMTDNGDVIYTNEKGKKTIYHICTTCSKCGAVTEHDTKCSKCGSKLYKYVVYKVKKGDTLSEISGNVGASVNSIANLNEIDNVDLIYAGESLRIPD